MMKKVFDGPAGVYVYEEVEPVDHTNTATVTFRLPKEDVANLKMHLRNVVYCGGNRVTIDTDYYDSDNQSILSGAKQVNLSESYRVMSDMASQISSNYPSTQFKDA